MLSEEKILEYMQIPDDQEVVFYEPAAMKKLFKSQQGRAAISFDGGRKGLFTWQTDTTPSRVGLLHMGAQIEDIYDIKVKRKTLSFSWGGALRFVFESEAKAHECCRALSSIKEQITEARA